MNRFGFYYQPRVSLYNTKKQEEYVVQNGDSLYKIAKKYGISLDELIAANNITSSVIYPNQVLIIPVTTAGAVYFEEYVSMPDDTLELISQKLSVSPSAIAKYNDVTKILLDQNQTILIPRTTKTHEVVATDSVDYILRNYNMTLEELVDFNKDKWFKIGEVINVK